MAPNDGKANIPAWQRATSIPGAEDVKAEPESAAQAQAQAQVKADEKEPTHDRPRSETAKSKDDIDGLREQAIKFLNDSSIKDASRDRKAAFLASKGLQGEEIELLLSSSDAKARPAALSSTIAPPQALALRDIPPVVTYPEFLVQPEKPPPLVTKTFILNAAYITAGLYGTLYGLSKYIINPMQEQLSDARHQFITHSTNHLDALNSRLSDLVSTVPSSRPGTALKKSRDEEEDDALSESSDPTELYHRDFGTQTSPNMSRRNSLTSTTSSSSPPKSAVERAESQLKSIASHLKELASTTEDTTEKDEVSTQLSQLITSLNEMAYTSGYYKYGAGTTSGYMWSDGQKAQDDEIERLVKDVKALKGKFLGVRNFPRAAAGR